MSRIGLALIGVGVALTLGQAAFALPTYGENCASCHTTSLGTITITGNDTTANPVEACSVPDHGTLKVFQVAPGASRTLTATLSGVSGASYAFVTKGFSNDAVQSCGVLSYTGDSAWTQQGSGSSVYYYQMASGTAISFNLAVGAATPADYYDLVFAVAGLGSSRFYTEAHFYVQVVTSAPPASPTIGLSPISLAPTAPQGSNPPNGSFTVANSGGGTLSYTITANATWLSVSPASGSTAGPPVTHTVQYSTVSLAAGTYSASITVADPNATNSPQTISVSLTVSSPPPPPPPTQPAISLSPASLAPSAAQGASPPDGSFTVSNTGGGTLNYTITSSAAWLTVSPTSGSTTGPANTHTVHYSTASLAAGSYSATISVSDPNASNSPRTISVSLTISGAPSGQPTILLNKTSLSPRAIRGSNPPSSTFTVANSGGGTLNYRIRVSGAGGGGDGGDKSGPSWLTVSPSSGSTTEAPQTISVRYRASSLPVGTYRASITVSDSNATNSPRVISVTLTIRRRSSD